LSQPGPEMADGIVFDFISFASSHSKADITPEVRWAQITISTQFYHNLGCSRGDGLRSLDTSETLTAI